MPRKIRWSKYWIIKFLKKLVEKGIRKIHHLRPIFGILVADMLEYLLLFAPNSHYVQVRREFFYTEKIWIGASKRGPSQANYSRLENES